MGVNSCGTTMLDQGAFVGLASIDWDTTPKTANFTAVSGNGYFVNTTSGAVTLTLPAGSAGDIIAVSDYASTFGAPAIPAVYSNPESTLGTADLTVSSVSNFSGLSATVRTQDLYSAVDVGNFDSTDYGVIWEVGGTGDGFAASLEAGGELYVAAYTGSSWQASGQAYLKVDVSSYYNTPGTFYTTIDHSAKQFKLYFQPGGPTGGNQAISLGTSTAGTSSQWCGDNGGALGQVNSDMVNFGFTNYNTPFTGDAQELRWYYNTAEPSPFQSITTPAVPGTPLTISPNGTDKINGTNENAIISVKGICFSLIYVDSTQGWKSIESNSVNPGITFITATGGTITTDGDFKIHTFTGPGTFTVCETADSPTDNVVDYLVIAGGGAGGTNNDRTSGGGGAGGYRESSGLATCFSASPKGACVSALPVSATSYPITVGAGGIAPSPSAGVGGSGSNSIFSSITSAGGGGGGISGPTNIPGVPGGSGGGESHAISGIGSGNTPPTSPPQGNDGGNGYDSGNASNVFGGGGGGGATAVGGNASTSCSGRAGAGGDGATSSINGSPTARGGGGGGGAQIGGTQSYLYGLGGLGGGGQGGHNGGPQSACFPASGTAGTANTGGGGGGGSGDGVSGPVFTIGSNGGSGIVIIRYRYQ